MLVVAIFAVILYGTAKKGGCGEFWMFIFPD